jgi:DNA-3-methyladenine glycosylase
MGAFQSMKKLPRLFYARKTISVAKALLGKHLVRVEKDQQKIGRIVEVEAYLGPHDLAAHSAKGRTARTEVMFGAPGHAYVYLIYGMYHCMNVVTEEEGHASAVLIRAVQPLSGIEARTQGPGLLCRAMNITRDLNGRDLVTGADFYIGEGSDIPSHEIIARPRIGVDYAGKWKDEPLRYYIKGSIFVSKP